LDDAVNYKSRIGGPVATSKREIIEFATV